uniref:Secreted protein n=1 Tax=Steinernema glaseri TaxID=37863 RepID=A0A1I7YTQ6_9BILA
MFSHLVLVPYPVYLSSPSCVSGFRPQILVTKVTIFRSRCSRSLALDEYHGISGALQKLESSWLRLHAPAECEWSLLTSFPTRPHSSHQSSAWPSQEPGFRAGL